MHLINAVLGVVALRVSNDEVTPAGGLVVEDMIKYLGDTYQFTGRPRIPSGIPLALLQPFVFQSGSSEIDGKKVAITYLAILPNGDIIGAANTEIADKVMEDYIARLDTDFGYQYKNAQTKIKSYLSHVVVEFDAPIAQRINALRSIEGLLAEKLKKPNGFPLKRLAFGTTATTIVALPASLEIVEGADFVIERRETEPHITNRYFSAAPTTTAEHLRILETIERELSK